VEVFPVSIIDDVSGGSRERTAFADESFGSFETEAGELVIYDRDDHASFIVSDRWSPVPR
jgi:hypothetical protein